jgi:hydroxymethylglutaryl-CoA reductase (NADPH)
VLRLSGVAAVGRLRRWVTNPESFALIQAEFAKASRFSRLKEIHPVVAGRTIHLRFKATSGDAMGMNMLCKGVDSALKLILETFPEAELLSLSGNMCTDKKSSAINWIEGRGKSVVCEAKISEEIVQKVLKTTIDRLIDVNWNKNLVGSALAGSIGGFNAHAANVVSAVFLATGQDVAQNVESSNCMTLMEARHDTDVDGNEVGPRYLYITCTMPSIEVGTIGGGTQLRPQASCLDMLGCRGSSATGSGVLNSEKLARVVCASVLAGELSLMSALAAGHLLSSHLKLNRRK